MKQVPLKIEPWESHSALDRIDWTKCAPFNVNPRGYLVHRVKCGRSYFWYGEYSHDAVTHWCGNATTSNGISLTDKPPENRLLCARCERLAVAAGLPSADELAGKHIHLGAIKVHRECCRDERN